MKEGLFDKDFANWYGNIFDDLCKFNPTKEDIQRLNVRNTPKKQRFENPFIKNFGKGFNDLFANTFGTKAAGDTDIDKNSESPIQ